MLTCKTYCGTIIDVINKLNLLKKTSKNIDLQNILWYNNKCNQQVKCF